MDTLTELIVQALVSLFSGGSQKPTPLPPPRQAPAIRPIQQQRQSQRPGPQRRQPPPKPRQQLQRQAKMLRPPGRIVKPQTGPPPVPRPAPAPAPRPQPPAKPPPAPSAPQPTITAAGIRQLMLSRRSAIRTIYVLSEVVSPPLALRE